MLGLRRSKLALAITAAAATGASLASGRVAGAGAAEAQPAPPAPVGVARLQGTFQLAGRVTVAVNVHGEHLGQIVQRIWTFTSECPVGQCPAIGLSRARANGIDVLVLHRRGPGALRRQHELLRAAALRGPLYPQGQKIPFTITVAITQASRSARSRPRPGSPRPTRTASASTCTPCVAVLGHDAARYHGQLLSQLPRGAIRSERSTRSSASS